MAGASWWREEITGSWEHTTRLLEEDTNKLVKHNELKKDTKISLQNSSPPNSYFVGAFRWIYRQVQENINLDDKIITKQDFSCF